MKIATFTAAALIGAALVTGASATTATAAVGTTGDTVEASDAALAPVGAVTPRDWNGRCHFRVYRTHVWGWCDGTGPQRYQILAGCSNGRVYGSYQRPWFGDRRGATAYCPARTVVTAYGWRRA